MRQFLARTAYWRSLGFDNSEYPFAEGIQRARERLLKQRIGRDAFEQFDDADPKRDPAYWATHPMTVAIVIIIVFMMIAP